jgi:hypothetical protein
MPHVLVVPAGQLGHPMVLLIPMEADDRTPHRQSTSLHLLN